MDLDNANKQLNKLDGILTTIGVIFKKHWGKLLLLSLGAMIWWFILAVDEEMENPSQVSDEFYEDQIIE